MTIFPRHRVALRQSSTVMQNLIGLVGIAITADIIVENTPPCQGTENPKLGPGSQRHGFHRRLRGATVRIAPEAETKRPATAIH